MSLIKILWILLWFYQILETTIKIAVCYIFMQIVYTAEGELLNTIVVHDGAISDSLHHHYSGKVGFIKTADGQLNYDCLGGCLQHIYE